MSVAGGDHVRQKCLGAVDDSPEVDVDDAFDVLKSVCSTSPWWAIPALLNIALTPPKCVATVSA